jgi:SPP1 gp7 family putative phage head morphogenesis protein
MGVKYSNCERLARTEFNHIANQATKDSYKQTQGIDEYKYVATLDSRTSEICQNLDGKVFPLSEAEEGVNYPPAHPNCRSVTIPYSEDEDYSKLERIATDPKSGKSYFIPANMTYADWKASLSEEQGKYFVSQQKSKAQYKSDLKQLNEYRKLATQAKKQGYGELFDNMPTRISEFQSMKYLQPEKWDIFKENARIARSELK